jgi:CubicO group peptidase (beta-lactamase class C family)
MQRRASSFQTLFLFALILLFSATAIAQSTVPADLDAYVARSMKEFEIPGMALAIVKDGKVVYSKGYGVRKLGATAAVDENTLFGIASNTKAFTAVALAILVDEGKLSWDDPVIKHMPAFRLGDPNVTNELMVRDLLSHRAGLGLGQGDLLYFPPTDYTPAEVVEHGKYLKPVSSMRSKYAYNNFMFEVAAQLVAQVSGMRYDEFIRQRIFTPLGMSSSLVSGATYKPEGNWAIPHSRGWRLEGKLQSIAVSVDNAWEGAAGIKSNVTDLARWMNVQLAGGKLADGHALFSEAAQRQMWSMQIPIPISVSPNTPKGLIPARPQFAGYGLGWSMRDYHGHKIVSHGGALTGMVSTVQLVPDQKLGIVVLTNQEETGAYMSVVYHILDHAFQAPDNDWISAYKQARDEGMRRANDKEQKEAAARLKDSRTLAAPEKLAGRYHDDWYGDVTITPENGKLVLRFTHTPIMVADLEFWQYDTFKAVFRDNTVPDAYVTFWFNADGKVDQMKMAPTNDLADFSFDYQDLKFVPIKDSK